MTGTYAGSHWELFDFSETKVIIREGCDSGSVFCVEKIDPCAISGFHDIDPSFLIRIRIYERLDRGNFNETQIFTSEFWFLKGLWQCLIA